MIRAGFATGVAVVFVAACGSSPSYDVVYEDDFSRPADVAFTEEDDDEVSLDVVDGAYRVRVTSSGRPHVIRIFDEVGHKRVAVEADATQVRGPAGDTWGVGCWWGTPENGYVFLVQPGAIGIARRQPASRPEDFQTVLAEAGLTERIEHRTTVRVRGTCEATDDGASLAMYLDGERVLEVLDDHREARDRLGFLGFGFFIAASEGSEFVFDNVEIRSRR